MIFMIFLTYFSWGVNRFITAFCSEFTMKWQISCESDSEHRKQRAHLRHVAVDYPFTLTGKTKVYIGNIP